MNFNTILISFGLNPEDFQNMESDPIPFEGGFIHEFKEVTTNRECPFCANKKTHIHKKYWIKIIASHSTLQSHQLNILRVQYYCPECKKTFTRKLEGIDYRATITHQLKLQIDNDLFLPYSFSQIAEKYNLSTSRVIQIFDEDFSFVPRKPLPRVLCIDEIRFTGTYDSKYICILYDFESKDIVDIIKSRKKAYLEDYFDRISIYERARVKYFISDMYDGYRTICTKYLRNAVHIVDTFHIVTQLTRAVNQIRVKVMNGYNYKGDRYYNFMKSHWKLFLCRNEKIPDKFMFSKLDGLEIHYDKMVTECIKKDEALWTGYLTLQDIYHFNYYSEFDESYNFFSHVAKKLKESGNELLIKVGDTYRKWITEVANAYSNRINGIHYTNAIAENINNQLKTILKSAYGYKNFKRFRKRALVIITYNKKSK